MSETVYLSGPMTGIKEYNYPLFNEVAADLRELGLIVLNPADNPEPLASLQSDKRRAYLQYDAKALGRADTIVLLPGWEYSSGSFWEYCVARWLGLEVGYAVRLSNKWYIDYRNVSGGALTAYYLGVEP